MGREIRIGLILAAASCLMAVMVDWVLEELTSESPQIIVGEPQASAGVPRARPAEPASVGAPPQDTGQAHDATEGLYSQG